MPLAFMDGFDSYHTVDNTNITTYLQYHYQSASSNGPGPRTAAGRYNGKSITLGANKDSNWSLRLPINEFITTGTTKIIVGFNFQLLANQTIMGGISLCGSSSPNSFVGVGFSSSSIKLNNGVSVRSYNGNLGSYGGLSLNTWYHLSIVMTGTHAGSTYVCQVYLDDNYILAGTVTKGAERSYRIWSEDPGNSGATWKIDDLYVLHNDGAEISRLDPSTRIETLLPTSAKDSVETWQYAGGASAFESCNNIPFVSNEYISTDTIDTVQEFEFQNLTNIIGSSYGQIRSLAKGVNGSNFEHIVNGSIIDTHTITDSLDSYTAELPTNVLNQLGTNNIQAGVSS